MGRSINLHYGDLQILSEKTPQDPFRRSYIIDLDIAQRNYKRELIRRSENLD